MICVSGGIGFDGIWQTPYNKEIVIEVKTTYAYCIDLDTISKYRKDFIKKNNYCNR